MGYDMVGSGSSSGLRTYLLVTNRWVAFDSCTVKDRYG
jgi:hypothetical protein